MVVKIGRITAVCPACDHEEFRCSEERPVAMDVMTCDRCGTKVTYGFLTEQIAQKSIDEADAALKAAKEKKHPKE
jgi:hypothetical protein